MESDRALQAANNLIKQLQSQVAVLTRRIQVLERENTRLSENLSSCHNMHEARERCEVLCNGDITVAESNEINQGENKRDFDIHDPNEQDLSTLYFEDTDNVNFQYSSGEDNVVSGSLNMHAMAFENTDSSVKNTMQGCQEVDQRTTLGQVHIENEPLAKLDTISGQIEAGNCLLDDSSKFGQMSARQDDHVRKKTKDNKSQVLWLFSRGQHGAEYRGDSSFIATVLRLSDYCICLLLWIDISSDIYLDSDLKSLAFKKNRLLVGDLTEAQYTRCGRTDRGVSSFGQVVALYLRSKHKSLASGTDSKDLENISDEKEIDYVTVMNRALPSDIRVLGWSPVPDHFHAREWKLHVGSFWENTTSGISCKEVSVLVYRKDKFQALASSNFPSSSTSRWAGKELMAMWIKGSAFLWHQVRCMAAVLFMIGQGMESPTVIDELLDTNKMCRKPQYILASELPLVLQTCEFVGLKFRCSSDSARTLHLHMEKQLETSLLQSAIFHEALSHLPDYEPTSDSLLLKRGRKKPSHVPLRLRPTEPTYEERHMKLRAKSENKCVASDHQKAIRSSKMVTKSYKGKKLHLDNASGHQTRDP